MDTAFIDRVTDSKGLRSLFVSGPDITIVGYWWFNPPDMNSASYTVLQPMGRTDPSSQAEVFAHAHGGSLSPVTVSRRGVRVFRVILPKPRGNAPADTFVELGRQLYAALNKVGSSPGR